MKLFSLALLSLVSSTVSGLTPAQWRGQSVYQVLTDRFARSDGSTTATCNTGDQDYCGGTWRGIINQLDYIQGMGFTAVWISPVTKQLVGDSSDGESYHGYWQQNIYELNSNFGTADDLRDLSAALHARGMYLMVDIVTNHFAYLGCGDCVDYSQFVPFNSESYFHDFCLINYNDVNTIKNCWMGDNTVSLPDMRTEDSYVASVWNDWISDLVANYSIDGLRLDSAQQVNNDFFPPFETAAGVYIVGEVFNGDPAYVCPYQNSLSGILNFPTYFWVTQAFQSTSGSISNLVNGINNLKSTCKDTTLMGSFLENHDVQRFPYLTSDLSLTKNAIAFTILQDGIPIVYYGQEQRYNGGDVPYDREALWFSGYSTSATLYTFIGSVNQIRNQAIYKDPTYLTYKAYPVYSDSSTIVMRKGFTGAQIIAVFSNLGASGSSYTLSLTSSQTGFTANQALVEVLTCTAYTTDSSGTLAVAMSGGLPRILYPTAQLVGSGICGVLTGTSSTTLVKNSVISTASSTNTSTPSSSATTSTTASTATTTCTPSPSIAITFNAQIPTVYGETIKLIGSIGALGSWAPENAIALDAYSYTASEPLWQTTISLAPGTSFEYKFINVAANGRVSWEADPNRSFTVPVGCGAAVSVVGRWQG